MQIRLTVVDPLSPPSPTARTRAASCDVLVTAPAGTALAAVSSALASAVSGSDGPAVLYAASQRLDGRRCTLGEPPLIDGAVLSVGAPLEPEAHPELDDAPTQLHVVAGPDAGGVHLLHGGEIRVGRSADADVALDDPDVSRMHCAVTVAADGRVAVADLGSTNGTLLDGTRVTGTPVRFPPGALLRVGESTLRLAPSGGPEARATTTPDGEGHVRVPGAGGAATHARVTDPAAVGTPGPVEHTHHAYGTAAAGALTPGAGVSGSAVVPGSGGGGVPGGPGTPGGGQSVPGQGGVPWVESRGGGGAGADGGPSQERPVVDSVSDSGAGSRGGGEAGRIPAARPGGGSGGADSGGDGGDAHGGRSAGAGAGSGATRGAYGSGGAGASNASRSGGAGAQRALGSGGAGGQNGFGSGGAGGQEGFGPGGTNAPGLSGSGGAAAQGAYGPGAPNATRSGGAGPQGVHGSGGAGAQGAYGSGGAGADADLRAGAQDSSGPGGAGARDACGPGGAAQGAYGPGRAGAPNASRSHDTAAHGAYGPGGAAAPDADGPGDTGAPNATRSHGAAVHGTYDPQGAGSPEGVRSSRGVGAQDGSGPSGTATPGTHSSADTRAPNPAGPADTDTPGPTPVGTGTPPLDTPHGTPDPYELNGTAGRKGTPVRGTDVPQGVRRRGGLSAWARRLAGGRGEQRTADRDGYDADGAAAAQAPCAATRVPETWPDPAALLLTALGPGPRLWERGPGHPEALAVRLGTADRTAPDGSLLPAVPVTAGLREVGALGLAGPRARLAGLARTVLAQLAALHSPDTLEITLITADRSRSVAERTAEWSWLGWLPHLRPGHGQDCRLLLAYDREQATARTDELLRRLDDHLEDRPDGQREDRQRAPQGDGPARPRTPAARATMAAPDAHVPLPAPRRPSWAQPDEGPRGGPEAVAHQGPYTVLVVDGDPGGADVREAVVRLAVEGPRAGIHVVCLAETAPASPASPVTETYEAACAASPVFRECGAVALLSGDVATALRLLRVARADAAGGHAGPVGHGTVGTVDAVSLPWAERFARALAPLRTDGGVAERARVSAPLPQSARLLDELGLARATPASLMARWAAAADDPGALGGRACAVLGAGPRGPVGVDLAAEGPHLLVEGPPGSGRTELLRAVVASLAAAERPDRLGIVLVDGRGTVGTAGGHGEGLRAATDVSHVTTHLAADDPVRMREFAQSLSAELKRRAELLGRSDFTEWHTGRELSGRLVAQRTAAARGASGAGAGEHTGDLEGPSSSTLRLRPGAARRRAEAAAPPLPRLVVVVDDLDALVSPALGSPGRPAAGSVLRALEAVAREGERLGVHLVAASAADGRTARTEAVRRAGLRVTLDAPAAGPEEPAPGRGRLTSASGRDTPFQGGRVTGRIPRTATLRPTVVPLEWHRMGDPPARRPVRELGNGPTDLALLASALERAARQVSAAEVPSLL
ncbi:FHA domain-containing protein [Streptomyces sp. NPDC051207]|uniref:FHA domain-containing protein n=1 Tax=Streptomyces sp. NPDC051207 TaxID=3154641 RepID=UPI0034402231